MWWQVPNRTGTWRPTAWLGSRDSNYGICQDRNPFELRREFLPDLAKRKFKDVSSVSCALAALQLRQGFWQVVSSGRAELSSGLKCLTRAGRRTRTAEQAKKIIEPSPVSARLPLWTEQCMWPNTEPSGSLLSPASAARPPRGFGGGGATSPPCGTRAKNSMLCSMSIAAFSVGLNMSSNSRR
jgi:hypothetical protein